MSKKVQEYVKCAKCKKDKAAPTNFYKSSNNLYDGFIPTCKQCLRSMIDYDDKETVFTLFKRLDIPFHFECWEKATNGEKDTLGRYLSMANALKGLKGKGWEDSVFAETEEAKQKEEEKQQSEKIYFDSLEEDEDTQREKFLVTHEIIDKWGEGYQEIEYRSFEKKYHQLKNNYPEKTAMHTESLLTYIRYRVKEELATAEGDVKTAKSWGDLAQKAAQDAKINPSQLTKSDLSDGLDGFGQLVRAIEQAIDVIPILPKFKEKPQDKVDFTLWCYINYIRDLQGLPLVPYEDIYQFYEERKKEYEADEGGDFDAFI
ncbi:hypothetical protein [Chengkuizengella marina]|uniref:Uncharacterized protein n=1 Tax=Chengkuizengella marina TaxID=2507566 RepID=A0A6N9PYL1_9BACL|nr:hypothetical protein [Chengkuizengella marina]NBI28609.1 hypothetical protein [Chengkuizengella marina]